MNDTNDDAEFFDATPVSPNERGESFGLTPGCYGRMARAALRAMTTLAWSRSSFED